MGLLPESAFTVRNPAWWDLAAEYDLDEYPGREKAMALAGHDFNVGETTIVVVGKQRQDLADNAPTVVAESGNLYGAKTADGWKALIHSATGDVLNVVRGTYEVIQNSVAYDVAELLFDQGFQYETGITLDGGRLCALTLLLDEPIILPGEDSLILPFGCLSWSHDGTSSLRVRSGTLRQVCANTIGASEAEGARLGTQFTFRHTKNVHDRIEDAKEVVRGTRAQTDAFREAMLELCKMPVTPAQRDLFVSTIIGDKDGTLSNSPVTTDRVKSNIEAERAKINALFMGQTIPESHTLTGYGLHLAGVEYFDHLRAFKSQSSYVKRTLLTDNPAKASLVKTIREVVAA